MGEQRDFFAEERFFFGADDFLGGSGEEGLGGGRTWGRKELWNC